MAVSDSDLLIHLAKLNKLEILNSQFSKIYVSKEIEKETVIQGIELKKEDAYILKIFFGQGLMHVETVDEQEIKYIMNKYNIHKGESSILFLAKKFKVSFFLTNETKVRKIARTEGFNVVGTIGIILKSYDLGQLTKEHVNKLFNEIQNNPITYRIHPILIKKALKRL